MTRLDLKGLQSRLSRLQILSLKNHGFVRPLDLMNGDAEFDARRRKALPTSDGAATANLARDAARQWKMGERLHSRSIHKKRARLVGAEDIIEALYACKGEMLESAFEAAMKLVSIGFERVDMRGRQAHPDYTVKIGAFPKLVVEIKSKLDDTDLVSLNGAIEVLTSSELIGLRDNFCVTVCSPGFEPNVPSLVEACARLCVVEVSDLSEALLRLCEKTLSLEDFHNWISSPGTALSEDLPSA